MRSLRAACFLLVVGFAAFALAQTGFAEDKLSTITGSVRDTGCFVLHKMSGEDHRECALACANKGTPLGIEADDGNYYIAVSPGHPMASANALLSKYAEQKVKVTGVLGDAKGQHVIAVSRVEAAR
jgi:hypothetical protein